MTTFDICAILDEYSRHRSKDQFYLGMMLYFISFQRAVEKNCLKMYEQFAKFHHTLGSETTVDPTQPGNT